MAKKSKSKEKPVRVKKENHIPMVTFTAYKLLQIPLMHEHYCSAKGVCSCTQVLCGFERDDDGNMIKRKYKRVPDTIHCFPKQKYTIPKTLFEAIPQLVYAKKMGKLICHCLSAKL